MSLDDHLNLHRKLESYDLESGNQMEKKVQHKFDKHASAALISATIVRWMAVVLVNILTTIFHLQQLYCTSSVSLGYNEGTGRDCH